MGDIPQDAEYVHMYHLDVPEPELEIFRGGEVVEVLI